MTKKIKPLSPTSMALLPDASSDEKRQKKKKDNDNVLPKQKKDIVKQPTKGLFDEFV